MSRLWHSGAEAGISDIGMLSNSNGSTHITSSFHTGGGSNYAFRLGPTTEGGLIDHSKRLSIILPTSFVANKPTLYYKSDVYIDALADQGTGLVFVPLRLYSGVAGINYPANLMIYNSGGTLRAVVQYNSGTDNYDAGAAHSADVPLGVGFDEWFRLEVLFDSSPDDGSEVYEVRVNGSTIISDTDLTYTRKSAETQVTMSILNNSGVNDQPALVYIDNLSFNDSSGLHNNTWIGEEYIVAVMPDGAGDSNPTAGTYASINEIPATTTATSSSNRIEISNTSDYAWFTLSSPGLNNVDHHINAVIVSTLVREDSAGNSSYNVGIKSQPSGREYYANGLYYPDLAYVYIGGFDAGDTTVLFSPNGYTENGTLLISETDPTSGSAWKPTGTTSLDNAQIGMRKVTGTPNIWSTWMGAMVAYSPKEAGPDTSGMLAMF